MTNITRPSADAVKDIHAAFVDAEIPGFEEGEDLTDPSWEEKARATALRWARRLDLETKRNPSLKPDDLAEEGVPEAQELMEFFRELFPINVTF